MTQEITCFKAYDARGRVPDELNEDIAYRVGRAYAEFIQPAQVAVGRDARLSSDNLFDALSRGLMDSGVDVLDLGLCGTEAVYFAAFHKHLDGGIMITASHNPVDYNGFKFVRHDARPISADSGLEEIRRIAEIASFSPSTKTGQLIPTDLTSAYINHLLGYLSNIKTLKPFKIVANSGNGVSGPTIDFLEPHLPFEFIKVQHEADGNFPNGVPNPLLPGGRVATIEAIRQHGADFGIAWDGDFDRCFFFDANGRFIEGYYIVGLLAAQLLRNHPGELVVHDPRLVWNTLELVDQNNGKPVQSKAGHAFIKETMREVNAIYGGEMSAHHYFRDFGYCDSGMIPWLLLAQIMSDQDKSLAELVDQRIEKFPVSGEINVAADHPASIIESVKSHYINQKHELDEIDGLSMDFGNWRFNLRASNTEPVLRMTLETRADYALMEQKRDELLSLIGG
ncbi:MAG: phosphomannomutase [Gammaproteobacteria bacterium]|nr:phosphomannomutase [Gammaproteobacteria bacterium]